MVLRDVEGKSLYFAWNFAGVRSSGSHPRVTLKMETRDDQFDEKLALWDRVVDSLSPAQR